MNSNLLNQIPSPVVLMDLRSSKIIFSNIQADNILKSCINHDSIKADIPYIKNVLSTNDRVVGTKKISVANDSYSSVDYVIEFWDKENEIVYCVFSIVHDGLAGIDDNEHKHKQITDVIPTGFIMLSNTKDLEIQYANKMFYNLICSKKHKLNTFIGSCFHNLVLNYTPSELFEKISQDKPSCLELHIRSENNTELWLDFKCVKTSNEFNDDVLYCNLTDISIRKELVKSLEFEKDLLNRLTSLSDELLFHIDLNASTIKFLGNNLSMLQILKPFLNSINTHSEIKHFANTLIQNKMIFEDDIPIFEKFLSNVYCGIVEPFDFRIVLDNDSPHYFRIIYDIINDDLGNPFCCIGKTVDIQSQKELEYQARTDLLTKLLNKVTTETEIKQILANDFDSHVMFIVDIDNFKNVNDNLGHHFGDMVLKEISSKLKACFRSNDIVGRIGGDEFIVFLKGIHDRDFIEKKAMQIIEVFKNTYSGDNKDYKISGSVGISMYPFNGDSYTELYKASDKALYQSKQRGKDCYTIYTKEMALGTMENTTIQVHASRVANSFFDTELISTIFDLLYDSRNIAASINMVLKIIGNYLNVDRSYIFETFDSGEIYSNTFEWCKAGISEEIGNLQDLPKEIFYDFFNDASDNGILYCNDLSFLKDTETYKVMDDQGIKSFLHSQVKNSNTITLFLGVDDCTSNRVWTEKDINTLLYISKILSIFLMNEQATNKAKNISTHLQTLLSEHPYIYMYVIEEDTYDILYLNQSTHESFNGAYAGNKCYNALHNKDSVCENCPLAQMDSALTSLPTKIFNECLNSNLVITAKKVVWNNQKSAYLIVATTYPD